MGKNQLHTVEGIGFRAKFQNSYNSDTHQNFLPHGQNHTSNKVDSLCQMCHG